MAVAAAYRDGTERQLLDRSLLDCRCQDHSYSEHRGKQDQHRQIIRRQPQRDRCEQFRIASPHPFLALYRTKQTAKGFEYCAKASAADNIRVVTLSLRTLFRPTASQALPRSASSGPVTTNGVSSAARAAKASENEKVNTPQRLQSATGRRPAAQHRPRPFSDRLNWIDCGFAITTPPPQQQERQQRHQIKPCQLPLTRIAARAAIDGGLTRWPAQHDDADIAANDGTTSCHHGERRGSQRCDGLQGPPGLTRTGLCPICESPLNGAKPASVSSGAISAPGCCNCTVARYRPLAEMRSSTLSIAEALASGSNKSPVSAPYPPHQTCIHAQGRERAFRFSRTLPLATRHVPAEKATETLNSICAE